MLGPNVVTTVRDPEHEVTYHIYAYRKLTRAEAVGAVRYFLSQQKRKPRRPRRNTTIRIETILGATSR
jgi:hypothetical protein